MKEERKKRYKEKIDYAKDRISDLEDWLYKDAEERKTFFASEKAFQEAIEALADISAMMLSDLSLSVKDDYSNIEKLKEKKILSKDEADVMAEANGLRNRIIHRYNHVDENIFVESAKELLPKLDKLFDNIWNIIQKWKK